MARSGETVLCGCGSPVEVIKDRLPWHKLPGSMRNCQRSGITAESYDAVAVAGGYALRCPACEGANLKNASGKHPLVCTDCGMAGGPEFVVGEIAKPIAPTQQTYKGRYR